MKKYTNINEVKINTSYLSEEIVKEKMKAIIVVLIAKIILDIIFDGDEENKQGKKRIPKRKVCKR